MTARCAIQLDAVEVAYGGRVALGPVSGCFEPGSMTAIIGANGAGKSTLVKALVGLANPSRGRITGAARRLGYLAQGAEIDRDFPITVRDVVLMGAYRRLGWLRAAGREDALRLAEALDLVGLAGFERRRIGALSAGELQRVLFARMAVEDAPVIILDEPFNAVDRRTVEDLLAVILRWQGEGRTVIAVLHDLDLVRRAFPATLLLARRLVAWGPTEQVLSPEHLGSARLSTLPRPIDAEPGFEPPLERAG